MESAFKIGQIWIKQTESWCDNDPKGTPVKIVGFKGRFKFVVYKNVKQVWGFYITIGQKYILSQTAFKMIYEKK